MQPKAPMRITSKTPGNEGDYGGVIQLTPASYPIDHDARAAHGKLFGAAPEITK
jgi:hypothetical protein